MRYSKLIRTIFAVGVVAAVGVPAIAATPLSIHPSTCVLARNGSPWDAISGATYAAAKFTNSSGSTAIGYCPVPHLQGNTQISVYTTQTATVCNLLQDAPDGTTSVIFGGHSSNHWTFTVNTTPGAFVSEVACTLANGAGINHIVNY
jgi:hypothetical protein